MTLLKAIKNPLAQWFPEIGRRKANGLGTFSGVYLPSILQMLGVVLFMRLSWITGHVGILKMSLIISIASMILFITGLSLTSIVTNMRVGSGGSYYIISRSLGIEFGSAIGILLSISQLTTISICLCGFAISLQEMFPSMNLTTLQLLTLFVLALISCFPVEFALHLQAWVYLIVLASIGSLFLGSYENIPPEMIEMSQTQKMSFWVAFALFFPATTGIESGMALSGDLKTPSRSLAIGIIGAVVSTYIIYMGLAFFLSTHVPSKLLCSYPLISHYVSYWPLLFTLGIWGATLSSALGGLITAPRTLQALAKDKILPSWLSHGYGKIHHPWIANGLVILLAAVLTLLIDMNHLLPILSMVCLMTYGLLNFVTFFESVLQNPSYRPLFFTPPFLSLLGTLSCVICMFMINAGASFIALALVGGLCFWATKRKLKGNFDDIRYSIFSFFASFATSKLVHLKKNPKNWRPNILAIIDPHLREKNIIAFANRLNQAKGFLTFGTTLTQPYDSEKIKNRFETYFTKQNISCFYHINAYSKVITGHHHMIQNYGLGPLQPNTILLKMPQQEDKLSSFSELLIETYFLQKNIILLKTDDKKSLFNKEKKQKKIDLWWRGHYPLNFELSLALAHLLQHDKTLHDVKITLKILSDHQTTLSRSHKTFQNYMKALRFKELAFKFYLNGSENFYSYITKYAKDTDLTFLGLRPPKRKERPHEYGYHLKKILEKTEKINAIAYVLAGEKLNFQKIFK